MDRIKMLLAVANFAVMALNLMSFSTSEKLSDLMAAIAWAGSGTYWLWQAMA